MYARKRAGAIVATWNEKPTMFGVKKEDRDQDKDIDFVILPDDDPEVVAHRNRPLIRTGTKTVEEKLREITDRLTAAEAEVAVLKNTVK